MVILDASVLLQVAFQEEYTEKARRLVVEADSIQAPHILWYEVGNGLVRLRRRRMIDQPVAEESFRRLLRIPITLVEIDKQRTLRSALKLEITFYDAAYIDAALTTDTELYTADDLLYERALMCVKAKHIGRI